MDDDALTSSPDPISILADSSPAKPRRAGTPIRPKSRTFISPTKSIVLNAQDPNGRSPWKIKVTVEAEPGLDIDRKVVRRSARNNTSIAEPLEGISRTSPVKRKGRPCKSSMSESTLRSPRRRTRRTARATANATRARSLGPNDRDDGATSAHESINTTQNNRHEQRQGIYPGQTASRTSSGSSQVSQPAQRKQRSFSPSPSTVNNEEIIAEEQNMPNDNDSPEGLVQLAPGDATTIESEEFSMISVDSLSSHQPIENNTGDRSTAEPTIASASYMPSSPPITFPQHTPQLMQSPEQPDAPLQSFVKFPHVMTPMRESAVRSGKVLQDIVRSPDRDAMSSRDTTSSSNLFAGFSADTRRQLRQSLHMGAAIASRESSERVTSSPTKERSSSSGIRYPALEVSRSDHRLPTPDDRDQDKSISNVSSGPPVYPRISPSMHEKSAIEPASNASRRSYDIMSWAPTGPARLASPAEVASTSKVQGGKGPMNRNNVIVVPSDSSEDDEDDDDISEAGSDDDVENDQHPWPDAHPIMADDEADIWQQEASEPVEEEESQHEVSALLNSTIAPRRSKIPGTWRRTSGTHFHYSDSPEPETIPQRQVSSAESSGRESGVVTPPTTDDEQEANEEPHDSFQEEDEKTQQDDTIRTQVDDQEEEDTAVSEVLSPFSEDGSPDGEDTGLFWHSNLPHVFQGRRGGQNTGELSAISELKPISSPIKSLVSSVAKRPSLTRSPVRMRPVDGNVHSNQQTSSLLSSPLRKSLLKSSKIGGSPVSKLSPEARQRDPNVQPRRKSHTIATEAAIEEESEVGSEVGPRTPEDSEEETEATDVASATRQLLSEMAAQDQRCRVESSQDLQTDSVLDKEEQSGFDTTYLNGSRSYVENLNLSSPTKIKVRFNDSSHLSNQPLPISMLSPKKYHSLFEDDAPLGESIPSQTMDGAAEEPHQSPPTLILPTPEPPRSLLSRMNTSFWSAITSKSPLQEEAFPKEEHLAGSSSEASSRHDSVQSPVARPQIEYSEIDLTPTPEAMPVVRDSTSVPETNTCDDLLRLRRKYGLLTPSHPFTMCHARTLHRLLNSIRTHEDTTLIPETSVLPLPTDLAAMRGTDYHSATFQTSLTFTTKHLRVINAFMYLLLEDEERARLERNGAWGDEGALQARGWDSRGRHGTWFAFAGEGRGGKEVRAMRGPIESTWVAGVLAEVVLKEERMALVRGRQKA
ncbi:Hypothetical protein D9617_4g001910 [Elsinoe fawcettii]|nr:Hypothetical protein D9617_4g001910 [Elsinoe fawcettii]